MADPILFFGIPVEILALILSAVAIVIVALKDFIIPFVNKPKFKFEYSQNTPFYKKALENGKVEVNYFRFKVINQGRAPAKNCRVQIFYLRDEKRKILLNELIGFPLAWASRPEAVIDQLKAERLNIGIGESEFVDVIQEKKNLDGISLKKWHSVPDGFPNQLYDSDFTMKLLFSGDNFNPVLVSTRFGKTKQTFGVAWFEITGWGRYYITLSNYKAKVVNFLKAFIN